MDEDCYAVDATYDENDLPTNDPKVWDCSKDTLGEPKPDYSPVPDIRRWE
jgi:hypothetical protein